MATDLTLHEDRRGLARHLFALATALAEGVHAAGVAGQSPRIDPASAQGFAHRLHAAARDLTTLADAIAVVVRPDRDGDG